MDDDGSKADAPLTPDEERALRDINGECSAQCVAAPAARSER